MPGLRVLFLGGTGIISSASAYQTPPSRVPVVESTPLRNPYLQYSRDKIACEELLRAAYRDDGFPATIVRPSHIVAWYDEDPARQRIDAGVDAVTGKLAQAFRPGP
jgi:nucleoside-diphosphate-sugar epimerase